jgi:hypothetical protein
MKKAEGPAIKAIDSNNLKKLGAEYPSEQFHRTTPTRITVG